MLLISKLNSPPDWPTSFCGSSWPASLGLGAHEPFSALMNTHNGFVYFEPTSSLQNAYFLIVSVVTAYLLRVSYLVILFVRPPEVLFLQQLMSCSPLQGIKGHKQRVCLRRAFEKCEPGARTTQHPKLVSTSNAPLENAMTTPFLRAERLSINPTPSDPLQLHCRRVRTSVYNTAESFS